MPGFVLEEGTNSSPVEALEEVDARVVELLVRRRHPEEVGVLDGGEHRVGVRVRQLQWGGKRKGDNVNIGFTYDTCSKMRGIESISGDCKKCKNLHLMRKYR